MARRRQLSFRAYARRRWRVVGLTLVLMAGTLLFLTLVDRGHEPLWREEPGATATVAAAPDGRTVFVPLEDEGRLVGVEGYDTATGNRIWSRDLRPLNLSAPAFVASGRDWFAVASSFPGARLLAFHARGGNELADRYLPGEPRAIAATGDRLVLALGSGNVTVYDGFQPSRTFRVTPFASALDAAGGRIAAGTTLGGLVVMQDDGPLLNATRPVQMQTVRLSDDGTRLVVGGRNLNDRDIPGRIEYFDLGATVDAEPEWTAPLRARASLADLSADGRRLLAVWETSARYTLGYWDVDAGPEPRWTVAVDGAIRNQAGARGGAALSSDGRYVAYVPEVGGDVTVVDAVTNQFLWRYQAEGATAVAFAERDGGTAFAVNARLVPNRPYDAVLFFDVEREPFWARYPLFPLALAAAEGLAGFAGVAIAYAWYRRQ